MKMDLKENAEKIDALLPQMQCGKCGYAGCRPYAEAIATGEADINQCPPGGDETIRDLATLTGLAYKTLDPAFGQYRPPAVALIREADCIGCTLCIQACPVDAIVGSAKFMHTVIAAECTGCELCVPPCPVDCIEIREIAPPDRELQRLRAAHARQRHVARKERLSRERETRAARLSARAAAAARKRQAVDRAFARASTRLGQRRRYSGE
jgi:electron transport complex protein RnfB